MGECVRSEPRGVCGERGERLLLFWGSAGRDEKNPININTTALTRAFFCVVFSCSCVFPACPCRATAASRAGCRHATCVGTCRCQVSLPGELSWQIGRQIGRRRRLPHAAAAGTSHTLSLSLARTDFRAEDIGFSRTVQAGYLLLCQHEATLAAGAVVAGLSVS